MKKKNHIIMASVLTIIILLLAFSVVNAKPAVVESEIYVFEQDLPSGTLIQEHMLKKILVNEAEINNHTDISYEDILGKYLHFGIKKGQMVLKEILYNERPKDIYDSLDEGMVLYTISIRPENANGWWLIEGGVVDVFVKSIDNENLEIIENVTIVRMMDEFGVDIKVSGNNPKILCLGVDQEKAQRLFIAENNELIKIIAQK